jgi:hypothetical protein
MARPTASSEQPTVDTDSDRYPTFVQGMRRILQEAEIEDVAIDRLEVNFTASGEATYRYWQPRALDSDGGYLGPQ